MKPFLFFCRGVGIAVVVMAALGLVIPGLNFRLCFGTADRCVLAHERR